MNLFARDLTDRVIFGTEITAGALQSINPIFIILLAPVMGMLWVRLGARNPAIAVKFGCGLILLGAGFLVMAWASTARGTKQLQLFQPHTGCARWAVCEAPPPELAAQMDRRAGR